MATEQRYQRVADKATKDVHDITINNFQARANLGLLSANEQTALLQGTASQYLTAKEGHALVETNNNPAMGAGSGPAKAIMNEYYLKPRSLGSINATRAQLQHLSQEIGAPDANIMKFSNELQADQTTLENQGISREANAIARDNRDIKNLQTEYDGTVAQAPAWMRSLPGFENKSKEQRAQLDTAYRHAGGGATGAKAARDMLETFQKGNKAKADAVPDKHKKVIEAQ